MRPDGTTAMQGGTRRRWWWRRLLGLVLGMAVPTWIVARILSIPPISAGLNRRIWCPDAVSARRVDVFGERRVGGVSYDTILTCAKDGRTVRTVNGWKLVVTQWSVAALIVTSMVLLLVGTLILFSRLRRRRAAVA